MELQQSRTGRTLVSWWNYRTRSHTSPKPVINKLEPSSNGNIIDSTSDGAFSISSNTTQNPFRTAWGEMEFEDITNKQDPKKSEAKIRKAIETHLKGNEPG